MINSPGLSQNLLSRIEDACLNASAPSQQRWVDGWLVRFCPGKARRSRSVNAVADGRLPLPDRLAASAAVFLAAGLPLFFRITPFSRPIGLDNWLARQGFHRLDETVVMVAAEITAQAEPVASDLDLELRRLTHAEFAEQVGALRASPAEHRLAHAQRLVQSSVPYQGWVLQRRRDGLIVACAQMAAEAELVGLYDVFTHPQHRGQGLSRRLCAALLAQARVDGARIAYLQVDAANLPARAVYRRLGFVDAYNYHYRSPEVEFDTH